MDHGGSPDRLSLLDASVPSAFEVRLLVIPPGGEVTFHEEEWRDVLVVVEEGELGLDGAVGSTGCFLGGDVLHLVGLGLRALRCRGGDPTVLAVVRRRDSRPQPRR